MDVVLDQRLRLRHPATGWTPSMSRRTLSIVVAIVLVLLVIAVIYAVGGGATAAAGPATSGCARPTSEKGGSAEDWSRSFSEERLHDPGSQTWTTPSRTVVTEDDVARLTEQFEHDDGA